MRPLRSFIALHVHDGSVHALVEFRLKRWRTEERAEFLELSRHVAMQVATRELTSVDDLLQQAYIKDPAMTVASALTAGSDILREDISVTRFAKWTNQAQPHLGTRCRFVQSDVDHGKTGVLVELSVDRWSVTENPLFLELSRYLVLRISLSHPESLSELLHHTVDEDSGSTVEEFLAAFHADNIHITRYLRWGSIPLTPGAPKRPAVAMRLRHL
jgi:elongation factor Ts